MGIQEWVILVLIAVLVVLLAYETRQYRKYVTATDAVMAMGHSMQVGFNQVATSLNKLAQDSIELRQDSAMKDQELIVIRQILSLHGEKLEMNTLNALFTAVDKLKAIEEEE